MKTKKPIISLFVFISILFSLSYFLPSALAFESTSASFEIHAGDIESTVGTSTSATFRLHNAGGQNATATSTGSTYTVYSGVLYWLYSLFVSSYDQAHYRWREDAGCSESATTGGCWPVNEDTQYTTFPKNTFKRLRLEVANDGGWTRGVAPVFTLEVAETTTCSSGTYSAVPTTYGANAWVIATSTNITDGVATTNVGTPPTTGLTDVGSTWVDGQTKTTSNTTSAITLAAGSFTEIEYALVASSNAVNGNTYCFRVTNNGATTGFVYTQYAKAIIASGLPATGTLDSAVFDTFTTGAALQGPAYNSIMWKGNQNGSLGKVQFQLATSDSSSGPWSFYGSSGGTCNTTNYYDTTGTDVPVELSCSPAQHNNQRYFRYRVRLCSGDCITGGTASPIVNDVVVNWAP
ncbi:MAG: hypothetical protein HY228_00155 [Candidatus Yonathbacteria bacterium]|nr:hypothetical protein [Candidatus Yonathbacteria bacterium]